MTFSENLLRARGQIAWILALIASTATIVHLEKMDFELRASHRDLSGSDASPPLDPYTRGLVENALAGARKAYDAQPTDSAAETAMIVAAATAVQAGILRKSEGRELVADIASHDTTGTPELDAARALAWITFQTP